MSSLQIRNANVVLPDEVRTGCAILIEKGVISRIAVDGEVPADATIDAGGAFILPGFVDVHNHGAVGIDANAANAEELLKVAEFLASNGVTAWMPTLVPDDDASYRRAIREIDRLMKLQEGRPVAQAVGVHYEGVFANAKMCGALRPEYFKQFSGRELDDLPRLKHGVHMMTLAPEIDGGIELITELVKEGWVVSIGHTKADAATLDAALKAGARHITHFFNAMTGIHHREIGVAGWGLSQSDVTFDIIGDGIHVDDRMLKFACRVKGVEKVSLISDSVAPAGLGDGEFDLWGEKVSVSHGETRNERGSIAGSVITLCDAVERMRALGFSYAEIAKMSSSNPARLLGLESERGSIDIGKRADLVALDESGAVRFTMIGGEIGK